MTGLWTFVLDNSYAFYANKHRLTHMSTLFTAFSLGLYLYPSDPQIHYSCRTTAILTSYSEKV